MSDRGQRSPQNEIFDHLKILLGQDAVQLAIRVADLSRSGNSDDALNSLKLYDATLGGIGVYTTNDKRPLGVYRPWFYVLSPLKKPNAEDYSRHMILAACGYLEELLKHVVRLWPLEKIKADRLPMGALVKKASKHLPSDLADELAWLSNGVYNFAKHQFNLTDEFGEQQPEHYFQLEEAIAVFLISRHLGLRLEKLTGKSPEQLMME